MQMERICQSPMTHVSVFKGSGGHRHTEESSLSLHGNKLLLQHCNAVNRCKKKKKKKKRQSFLWLKRKARKGQVCFFVLKNKENTKNKFDSFFFWF